MREKKQITIPLLLSFPLPRGKTRRRTSKNVININCKAGFQDGTTDFRSKNPNILYIRIWPAKYRYRYPSKYSAVQISGLWFSLKIKTACSLKNANLLLRKWINLILNVNYSFFYWLRVLFLPSLVTIKKQAFNFLNKFLTTSHPPH